MAIVRFGDNWWIDTSHIVQIKRHFHQDTLGEDHESYSLVMDNNDTIRLNSTMGDAIIANLGTVVDGPDS